MGQKTSSTPPGPRGLIEELLVAPDGGNHAYQPEDNEESRVRHHYRGVDHMVHDHCCEEQAGNEKIPKGQTETVLLDTDLRALDADLSHIEPPMMYSKTR